MDVKASRRFTDQRERSFFNPINGQAGGGVGGGWPTNKVVCVYFLEGRCNQNPCRFAHTESPPPPICNRKLAIVVLRIMYGFPVDQKIEFSMFEIEKTLVILVLRTHHRLLLL